MGSLSIWHILFAVVVLALLFGGRGRISGIMGDTAKGIRAFQDGLKGEDKKAKDEEDDDPPKPLPKSSTVEDAAPKKASRAKSKTVS
jgi:sec-independent protein translocase protein TatA